MRLLTSFFAIILFLNTLYPQEGRMRGWEACAAGKSAMAAGDLLPQGSPNTPKHTFDVLNYTLELDLYQNFTGSYPNHFTAHEIIRFRVDTALDAIPLNASNYSLEINAVGIAGVSHTHANNILTIQLDRVYLPGEVAEVSIEYEHLNVADNAFYASGGHVFTDCEPEGARKWFPCWDRPSDKATTDITARVPLNVKFGSNGRLEDSLVSGDTLVYHWISRDPVATYLVVLTGRVNYNLDIVYWTNPANPGADPTPIRFYYNPGENPDPVISIITDVCDFFSEKFGEHPFEKNGFATLNNEFSWGGMENQTLTHLCPGCWYEGIAVHEFAHQWFGDMITCGQWSDIFLNEGFATYIESLWIEHTSGYNAYKTDVNYNANAYFGGNPGWPIANPDWAVTTPPPNELFNYAITYAKGACVMHMLRYVMGDSAFFAGMKNYATDSANLMYQSALIIDFRQHMEQAWGQPLDWYFDQWLYEPDHPVYQNTYNITNMGNGTWRVNFFAKQVQTGTVFFKMPVEIRVRFIDGSDTLIRVMNDVNNQLYSFFFNLQPTQVNFDPNQQIVLKDGNTLVGIPDADPPGTGWNLGQNRPNPASETTSISYDIPGGALVTLTLTDIFGRVVLTLTREHESGGNFRIGLNTADLAPGVYLYTLTDGELSMTRRMVIRR